MLQPYKQSFFTAREYKPSGWLKAQLQTQADGLSGNLDKVWPDVRDSRWIGGDREGWERVPYWLDGFIPLAWLLENDDMKARAARYIDAILERQQPDGWLCPCEPEERPQYDMWALFLICKVLVVYYDCTGDKRIEPAVYEALKNLNLHIDRHTLFKWSAARWYECLIPLFWLYERRPEEWMIDLAFKLKVEGLDHETIYKHWRFAQPRKTWNQLSHVVNVGMSLKSSALFSRLTGDDPSAMAETAYALLMRDHGMASGHFTGDECLAGDSPIHGSELCSVVEAMYSYEWLLSLTGNPAWADRLEALAYNALPATFSPDMWTHQYDQMSNQIQCTPIPNQHKPFFTNGGHAHLFGLEPCYGCCTANLSQGWPKFALATFYRTQNGVAIGAIAPGKVDTGLGYSIEIITDYPFEDGYSVKISSSADTKFALSLRVPSSASKASVDGKEVVPGGTHVIEKVWSGEETVTVKFEFIPEYVERNRGLYYVRRGPLAYSLPVKDKWTRVEYEKDGVSRCFPYCDYEVTPESPWNYAFTGGKLAFNQGKINGRPFDPQSAPVSITAEMVPVEWESAYGVCAETPVSSKAAGNAELLKLIPYGCTNLRMTEMPMAES